ncbi:hypothetical protein [Nitrosarchaeum koreense]|uniref:Uncharacterized protein n=1 Tax=Nitrosarchaeum koreense MY1 TaxID=1001994 RepID=F9CVR5_9ARCH|nr:hypothetical protein [Nitrosarchaeum koreense]EGP93367.1 hypothetical protein MY1_0602 [Nitrosarchaeum koreense MY1]
MEQYSTLLYKQRDKVQIQILHKIATEGKQSKKSLEITLEKHHPVIDNAVNQLENKKLIKRTKGDEPNYKRGQPQKFYRLTEKGISVVVDEIKIPLNDFWKMLFRIFDSEGNYYSDEQVNSKKQYVDERRCILKDFTIEEIINKYENNVLGVKRKHALSHMYQKIPDVQLITKTKFLPSEKLIVETIALYGSLSVEELSVKLSRHITNIPQKLLYPYFLIKKLDNGKYDITILGIQYLIFVIFNQLKHDTQMQKIKILIENRKEILPLIFRKWVWLTRFFPNRELFNTLIDAIDTNQRQLPFQTDSGIQEILDSHRNLEEVSSSKIRHEYEVGSEVHFEVRYEKGASLRGSRHMKGGDKDQQLMNLNTICSLMDNTSGDLLHKIDKEIQLVITELNKLNGMLGFGSIEKFHPEEMIKQRLIEYEQTKSDSLSFRFYSILLSQIYQKKEDLKKWADFLKTDKDIMPWYGNWIKEIDDFEEENTYYRNNLERILS